MFPDLRETANAPEILWTLTGALALIINLWLLHDVRLDARALDRRGQNGAKRIAVQTAIGIQAGLTLPQVIAVVIGVLSMLTPPENPARPVTTTLVVVTVGILLIEIILTGVALFTRVRRTQLLDYLEAGERETNTLRHVETMAELTHNTEVTTEAREGAQDAYRAANAVNLKVAESNKIAGEASAAAMQSTDNLRKLMERLEGERKQREGDDR